ncbi:hypothetical protein OH77DRAFT_1430153 [Trametes cingulata]|nr:hypothetical protein OH77DRAFT_1430153 [Trametes cingulata]
MTSQQSDPSPRQVKLLEPLLFYDIPGKRNGAKAWSPNTWKTRYTLNIKGIPYKTIWVEYPDIQPLMKKIGALPPHTNEDGSPLYTLPAIYDPNTKTALAESNAIVRYLDKTYPAIGPRLIPAEMDALHAAFRRAFGSALGDNTGYVMIPATVHNLRPRSEAFFRPDREASFGEKLEDISPPGPKREKYWSGVRKGFETMAQWLEADGTDKLFFTGDTIAFADITVAGVLTWVKYILGTDSEEWADMKTWCGGRWARFMEAFEQYQAVDVGEEALL